MEVTVSFKAAIAGKLRRMTEETGLESNQALIKTSLAHMEWLIQQVQDGRVIGALAEDGLAYRELKSAALKHVRDSREAQLFVDRLSNQERLEHPDRALLDGNPEEKRSDDRSR